MQYGKPTDHDVRNGTRAKSRSFAQKLDEEIAQLFSNATAIYAFHKSYRSTRALAYMIGLLDKDRASTWVECADKYELHVHQRAVEVNTEQAAYYAEQAAESAADAANAARGN